MGNNCRTEQKTEFELKYAEKSLAKWKIVNDPLINTGMAFLREGTYAALREAEKTRGGPVIMNDVVRAYKKMSKFPLLYPQLVYLCLWDFYWNDQILADKELGFFTLNPKLQCTETNQTPYDLYSDRMAKAFPGYTVDERMRVRPGPTTPVLNWNYMKDLLLSKDLNRIKELDWISENGGTFRFLDSTVKMDGQKVSFVSYPRSGNSFLRRFIELITGIVTGSDIGLELTLNLQTCGLAGEAHCNEDNVWITKSHSCMDTNFSPIFGANKMFFLMRNPLDVIPSHCTLLNTTSHSFVPKEKYHEDLPEYWQWFIETQCRSMKLFFERNHKNAAQTIPTYFVRYEDLLTEPVRVLTELFQFLFDVPSLAGTVLEAQILKHGSQKSSTKAVYGLKAANPTSLCRNAHMYTEEQLKYIKRELKEFLHFYGYVKDPSDPENKTAFFDYSQEEEEEAVKTSLPVGGYKQHNQRVLADLGKPRETKEYFYNTRRDLYQFFPGFVPVSIRDCMASLHVER